MDNQEAEEFLQRGIAAYQQGDYGTAVSLLQQATELNPQSFQAWEKYGAVLQQLGRYTEAIEVNKQAMLISGRNQNIFDLEESVNSDLSNTANTVNLSQYLTNQTIVNSETEYYSQTIELFNQGVNKYQAGDCLAAIQLWTRAIQIKSDYYEAYVLRGAALRNLGRYEEAVADCTQAIEINPDGYHAYSNRGAFLNELGRNEEAISDYTKAIEISPDDYQVYYNRGNALRNLGRYEDAIADFTQALQIKPNYYQVYSNRGITQYELGRYEEAITDFTQVIDIKPDYYQAYSNRGAALSKLGRYEEAITDFTQAINIKPDFYYAYFNRGNDLSDLGKNEEAITDFTQAINIKPDYYDAYNNRGNVLSNLGKNEEAIADYTQVIEIKPDYYQAYSKRGDVLSNLGRYEEAIADYTKAIEIKPGDDSAYNNRGNVLSNLGRNEEAITDYTQVIEIKPDCYQAYSNRGAALSNLGRNEEAITDFTQAIDIKPDDYPAYSNRGAILCDHLGKYEEAIADFERALEIKPDDFNAWRNRGVAFRNSGNYRAAITNWDEGLSKLNPEDKEYKLGCGTLHWFKGDAHYKQATNHYQHPLYQEALKSYHQALEFLKDNPRNRETYLQILKGLIKTYRAVGNEEKAKTHEDTAVNLLEKLLNEASSDYKIVLLRKFSGFFQLRVDRLARSQNLTQQKKALELAEARKNISLAWLQGKSTASPNYKEMQKIWQQLPPQTAIIYWHLSPVSLTTFLLTEINFQTFTTDLSPNLSQIELRKVYKKDNLENWLTNWKETYNSYSKTENSNAWRETLPQQLEKLAYFLSIPTLQEKLQTSQISNLILIPHRDLHLLPLHALFQLNSENPPTSFSYLPSIKQGLNKENNQANKLTNLLSVESSEGKTSLLFTSVEAAVIASFYDNCTTVKAKGNVIAALENPGDFLFTGHGYHNFTQPEKSALILGDEQLTVEEIFKSEISPRHLVTLSACETGLTGDKELIDEFVSLGSAFLAKGASYIITSLWRVDERATAILLMRFHQLIKDRVATVTAFNQAVNWLRDLDQGSLANWYSQLAAELLKFPNKRKYGCFLQREANILRNKDDLTFRPYTHPYYWAGFTITGVEPREKQKSGRLG